MNVQHIKTCLLGLLVLISPLLVNAQEAHTQQITDLDQLLETVRQQQASQRELNTQRERIFLKDKETQQRLIDEARDAFKRSQQASQPLIAVTEANEREITRLEKQLDQHTQSMGSISNIFHEFAGDFKSAINGSMVTAQFPDRANELQMLGEIESLPTIGEIQSLWLLLQQEMTEAAKVATFDAQVVSTDGSSHPMTVVRAGTFTAASETGFLRFVPETGELLALRRQPASRHQNFATNFIEGQGNLAAAVIDPSRGNLLGMMAYTPGASERIEQGGPIAKIILSLGALGVLLTLWRALSLSLVYRRVRQQVHNLDKPEKSNPLGRIMLAAKQTSGSDQELLLLRIDEAILTEIPALERGTGLIKLLAATAPLLGLLGTVTGMIVTFQSISLFGTSDPKLMAGGISQALVTTVLGLIVAIPLLFGHNFVASLSRSLVQRLDEQSAGMLARTVENQEQS
jgi:biopolymer transport protein ExbB